jgi:hypothetical protein
MTLRSSVHIDRLALVQLARTIPATSDNHRDKEELPQYSKTPSSSLQKCHGKDCTHRQELADSA